MERKKWSKYNPRPKPIGYEIDPSRQNYPAHLFNRRTRQPKARAMEEFYDRYYRYPKGVKPIYQDDSKYQVDQK